MRVLVIGGTVHSLVNFRGPLLREIGRRGVEVFAAAGEVREEWVQNLRELNVTLFPVRFDRGGLRPWRDLISLYDLWRAVRTSRPDMVFCYTIKPVIYGGLVARACGVPFIFSMVTGLGYAFHNELSIKGWLVRRLAAVLYRLTIRHSRRVFFQNRDDMSQFIARHIVTEGQCVLVNGSGVDLRAFSYCEPPQKGGFLLICRLLKDKGIREYCTAATAVRASMGHVLFRLAGDLDSNPASISCEELRQWTVESGVDYLGYLDDVRNALRECSVYVLPSYHEGMPRTVLEAMATGRAIITTDVPGCRETILLTEAGRCQQTRGEKVMEGENGYLIKARDSDALAQAMVLCAGNPARLITMGRRSREIAEESYDVDKVNTLMLNEMAL